MVQAARSGVQNIAEGSQASGTSRKTGIKLTNVARASFEELWLDYEDFLRQRALPLWPKTDPRRTHLVASRCRTAEDVARWVKEVHDGFDGRYGQDGHDGQPSSISPIQPISSIKPTYPEIAANAAHVLVGVACALLDRQIAAQAKTFEAEGGFSERLYRVRSKNRNMQQ